VFRATAALPKKGDVDVALKVYHSDEYEERSAREVRALKAVNGPTIARIEDAGSVVIRGNKCPYVMTSFVQGEVLASRLSGGSVTPGVTAGIGRDIALAIGLMWEARTVHRDIKPSNIMLGADGRAVLIDLGIARHLSLDSITTTGVAWGTPGYLSPEQARAVRQLSCASDVFSLGIVLQECLVGQHPTGRRQQLLIKGGPRTATVRADVPGPLADVIDSMVRVKPHFRPSPGVLVQLFTSLL